MSNKRAATAEVVKVRDQLVIIRERRFQLTAAAATRTKKVEGLLIDCAAAGRVFGVPIGLPHWNKVLAMPGHKSALCRGVEFDPLYVDVIVRRFEAATGSQAVLVAP
jgi:hypothetical protein